MNTNRKVLTAFALGIIFGCILSLEAGCSDAQQASIAAYGTAGDITCYSGGKVIYQGRSTGRIATVDSSDGWEFKDAATGKFVRVSGQCLITN